MTAMTPRSSRTPLPQSIRLDFVIIWIAVPGPAAVDSSQY
jgi:hypothetical protein